MNVMYCSDKTILFNTSMCQASWFPTTIYSKPQSFQVGDLLHCGTTRPDALRRQQR